MTKSLKILSILLFFAVQVFAKKGEKDSLYVVIKDGRLMGLHEIQKDENLYSIAQQYTVPALVLSQSNDISFYETLEPGKKLFIPMGNYNFLKSKPSEPNTYKSLYYNLKGNETYQSLAASIDLSEDLLRSWNEGKDLSSIPKGMIMMGWILYQSPDAPKANDIDQSPIGIVTSASLASTAPVVQKDTVKGPPSELELVYNYQTSNGQYVDSLDGTVVFFKPQTTVNNQLLYAFSNEIAKGRVLKVVNPSNGKFVYAKIIGNLPSTKQYLKAKIGLDGRARAELETREIKLWCTIFLKY